MHINIYIYSIRLPFPELKRGNLYLKPTHNYQSCRLQLAITARPCHPPSCSLQSTSTICTAGHIASS